MVDRSKYLPIGTMFIGLFVLSIGFNIVLFNKVNRLTSIVNAANCPVSEDDLKDLMNEIQRLSKQKYMNRLDDSNVQYDIKTKKQIKNDF